jgi:hypothetical protein
MNCLRLLASPHPPLCRAILIQRLISNSASTPLDVRSSSTSGKVGPENRRGTCEARRYIGIRRSLWKGEPIRPRGPIGRTRPAGIIGPMELGTPVAGAGPGRRPMRCLMSGRSLRRRGSACANCEPSPKGPPREIISRRCASGLECGTPSRSPRPGNARGSLRLRYTVRTIDYR